jgi:uncharacterized membrane protein
MRMQFFPPERMSRDFPWVLWAIGWLAIAKAALWLAYEPVLPEAILKAVGVKSILEALPLLACAVGLWNRRRWAAWGLTLIALLDLALLVVLPGSLPAYLLDSETAILSVLLSAVLLTACGPLGNVLILCAAPALWRCTRSPER